MMYHCVAALAVIDKNIRLAKTGSSNISRIRGDVQSSIDAYNETVRALLEMETDSTNSPYVSLPIPSVHSEVVVLEKAV